MSFYTIARNLDENDMFTIILSTLKCHNICKRFYDAISGFILRINSGRFVLSARTTAINCVTLTKIRWAVASCKKSGVIIKMESHEDRSSRLGDSESLFYGGKKYVL